MLDNCKPEDIDYTKPIIIKWWQSNGYYRINKYELVGDVVKWFTLAQCNDINIPELEEFKPRLTYIKDNLYWMQYLTDFGTKQDLEYLLTHNKGILTNNFDSYTYN